MPANLEFLHKEVGPLPVGGWALVVGAGLTFAWWRKRSLPTSTNSPDTEAMTDPTAGNPLQMLGLLEALNRGSSGPSLTTATDNNQWYQNAVRALLGRGNNPSLVDTALRKYQAGLSLTAAENAIVEMALQLVGPMPSPPPPPTTTPTANQPTHLAGLGDYQVAGGGSPTIQHLSNEDLLNASNLTYESWLHTNDPGGWAGAVGNMFGTSDPLPYLNEIARRFQAGTLPEQSLIGPVGPLTSGHPAWILSWDDLTNRLNMLQAQSAS